MPKFAILIHGSNYEMENREPYFYFWKKSLGMQRVGFYTTRFIDAPTANEAIELALRMVKKETETLGIVTAESAIEIDSIQEDDAAFDQNAPGKGFAFYTMDDGDA